MELPLQGSWNSHYDYNTVNPLHLFFSYVKSQFWEFLENLLATWKPGLQALDLKKENLLSNLKWSFPVLGRIPRTMSASFPS